MNNAAKRLAILAKEADDETIEIEFVDYIVEDEDGEEGMRAYRPRRKPGRRVQKRKPADRLNLMRKRKKNKHKLKRTRKQYYKKNRNRILQRQKLYRKRVKNKKLQKRDHKNYNYTFK